MIDFDTDQMVLDAELTTIDLNLNVLQGITNELDKGVSRQDIVTLQSLGGESLATSEYPLGFFTPEKSHTGIELAGESLSVGLGILFYKAIKLIFKAIKKAGKYILSLLAKDKDSKPKYKKHAEEYVEAQRRFASTFKGMLAVNMCEGKYKLDSLNVIYRELGDYATAISEDFSVLTTAANELSEVLNDDSEEEIAIAMRKATDHFNTRDGETETDLLGTINSLYEENKSLSRLPEIGAFKIDDIDSKGTDYISGVASYVRSFSQLVMEQVKDSVSVEDMNLKTAQPYISGFTKIDYEDLTGKMVKLDKLVDEAEEALRKLSKAELDSEGLLAPVFNLANTYCTNRLRYIQRQHTVLHNFVFTFVSLNKEAGKLSDFFTDEAKAIAS